jgi:cysteine desulfurase/selenocysteine lyase
VNLAALRHDFPVLGRLVHGKPLVYLDNGATSQKPRFVIEAIRSFYEGHCANIHRGVHLLSVEATAAYDAARARIASALRAARPEELVFTRGTTEGINLVARSWGDRQVQSGDEILLTEMEHHANIVPWQMLARRAGATLRVLPVTDTGELDLEALDALLGPRTKIFAFTHVSNVLGTVNPVAELCRRARERGIVTLVDGAQALPHGPVDLAEIGCDFYVFSGHKVFGPDGIGVLYARGSLLSGMDPYQSGGDMVERVTFAETTFRAPPDRFEAGTPNISGAVGLGAAFEYLEGLDWTAVREHEHLLGGAAHEALRSVPGLRIQGTAPGKAPVVSFTLEGVHPHDIGTILDSEGVAVRAGHHCAQPLLARLGVPSTARASFAFYNTLEEVETLAKAVRKAQRFFG